MLKKIAPSSPMVSVRGRMMDELASLFWGLGINTLASLLLDITHQVLEGVNSQEILTAGGSFFFFILKKQCMVCYRSFIILLLQNLNRFLVSQPGHRLNLAGPYIWIWCMGAREAWQHLCVCVCVCFLPEHKLGTALHICNTNPVVVVQSEKAEE